MPLMESRVIVNDQSLIVRFPNSGFELEEEIQHRNGMRIFGIAKGTKSVFCIVVNNTKSNKRVMVEKNNILKRFFTSLGLLSCSKYALLESMLCQ